MAKIPESYNLGNKDDLEVKDLLVIIENLYSDLAIAINKKPDVYERSTDGLTSDTFLSNNSININTSTYKVQMLTEHTSTSAVVWTELTPGTPGDLNSLTADDGTIVLPSSGNIDVSGNSTQGVSTSGSGSTLTITVADSTTIRKGVSYLATDAESISGSLTDNNVINPSSLKAKLGAQTDHGLLVGSGQTNAITALAVATNGQLPIGSTGADPVLATLTAGAGITITNGAGSITSSITNFVDTTAWTPVLNFGGASVGITYDTQLGTYARIGPIVFFTIYLDLSAKGTSVGNAGISGFPITIGSTSQIPQSTQPESITYPTGRNMITLNLNSGGTTSTFYASGDNVAIGNVNDTHFSDLSTVRVTGFYFA